MKRIIFRKEAETDLRAIIEHYEEVAPDAVSNILNDIFSSIDRLVHFPHLGMQVEARNYRRIVTLKYHFKVAYEVGEERVIILGFSDIRTAKFNRGTDLQKGFPPPSPIPI